MNGKFISKLNGANIDWTIESKFVCSRKPSEFSQNAGILIYQNDDNFSNWFTKQVLVEEVLVVPAKNLVLLN